MNKHLYKKLLFIAFFSIAFAFVESSVVIYLRAIYYPSGFHFPIKRHYDLLLIIEIIREFATLIMMVSISALVGRKFWNGFGYFLIIFGVWDIFFYLWLKITINWPESFVTPDILFLIPIPWIAPVLAPIIVSLIMIYIGYDIIQLNFKGYEVKPKLLHWMMVLIGSIMILYSFMSDIDAAFNEKYPNTYNWLLFAIGIIFYLSAHFNMKNKIIHNKSD